MYQGPSKHQEMGVTPMAKLLQSFNILNCILGQQPMFQMIGLDLYIHRKFKQLQYL